MRKMLVAMARDLRVLMIKLADRLHNMRTIAAVPHEKQQRVAQETLDIYAPLAHRLGMQEIKQQLEDLAFAALYPKRYAELDHLVATRAPERNVYLAKTIGQVQQWLDEVKIKAELTARGKHLWSIYEKMVQKGKEFDEVVIYEGTFSGRIVAANSDARRIAQSRLALRVAVTRAIRRTTIVTPQRDGCRFL